MSLAPASVGMFVGDVDTPALVVDLDALAANIDRMQRLVGRASVGLRPHIKTHKSPEIAHFQLAAGAVGICCQKVSEADVFVERGVDDVLITNELVGATKLRQLVALARRARVAVCVDAPGQVDGLEEAAASAGLHLEVLVEVDVGAERCGVRPGPAVVDLAGMVARSPSLRFRGLQCFHGPAQHIRDASVRRATASAVAADVEASLAALRAAGLACKCVTGGGTGTVEFDCASGVFTEVQPGSYVFMDASYLRNEPADAHATSPFRGSLSVLTTVMSRPLHARRAVVDAGVKALSLDHGFPTVLGRTGIEYVQASDEHGVLALARDAADVVVGSRMSLLPSHCDPTVNLYDWIVGVRDGVVEAVMPVAARGAVL